MALKPQDVVVVLKLVALGKRRLSYAALAQELFMSQSEVHSGIKRCVASGLVDAQANRPVTKALEEFLIHGLKYAFPAEHGSMTRGFPTGYAVSPLNNKIAGTSEPIPVWPSPEGTAKGYGFTPLYKSAPLAAAKDKYLYELLAIVDAIRGGRARERTVAIAELKQRLLKETKSDD